MRETEHKVFIFDEKDGFTAIITVDTLNKIIIPNTVISISNLYSAIKVIWKNSICISHPFPLHVIYRESNKQDMTLIEINNYWNFDWSYVYGYKII